MTLRLASRIATLLKQERERALSSALAACIRALHKWSELSGKAVSLR